MRFFHSSRASNIAFLLDISQMSDLDFGLIRQNISNEKASFQYLGCPLSLKSGKLWLNSYIYWISITSNWLYSQQFSLPYSKNILLVFLLGGTRKKRKKYLSIRQNFSNKKMFLFSPFPIRKNINSCVTSCALIQKESNWIQWKGHL